jgi:hypothetical protein
MENKENQRYKKGDIVKVLGLPYAPEMRIEHIDVDKIKSKSKEVIDGVEQESRPIACIWFDRDGRIYERKFNLRDLSIVQAKPRLKFKYPLMNKDVESNRYFDIDDTNWDVTD